MKKIVQIILISLATSFVVLNNVVFQYMEKKNGLAFVDQNDEDNEKSEKSNAIEENQQTKEFCHQHNFIVLTADQKGSKSFCLLLQHNQLPTILLDVELLPPNFS